MTPLIAASITAWRQITTRRPWSRPARAPNRECAIFFDGLSLVLPDIPGSAGGQCTQTQEGHVGHSGNQTENDQDSGGNGQRLGRTEHLLEDLAAHVLAGGNPRYHDCSRRGQQQRGNLCHQAVTNGQQRISLHGQPEIQTVLQHTNGNTANDVDRKNQQAGNGVALHKLGRTVHGAVEIRFLGDFGTTMLGLILIDQAGVQVRINRHLLAGHGIQRETGAHLGDPAGTLGHDQEVDDHQDRKHHQTHGVIAADQNGAEGFDHFTGGIAAFVAVQQNNPGRRHVQGETQKCGYQQDCREGRKLHRPQGVDTHQQNDNRQGDVESKEHVQEERRHGQNHHAQQAHQHDGYAQVAPRQGFDVIED